MEKIKLSDLIKSQREKHNATFYKVEQLSGISATEVKKVETGESEKPTLCQLIKLLNALNVTLLVEVEGHFMELEKPKEKVKKEKIYKL